MNAMNNWEQWVYGAAFLAGLGYALVVFLLGMLGGGHDGHGLGDHDLVGQGDMGHDILMSPFSPTVISMFLASFGGSGIICIKFFKMTSPQVHLPVSLVVGLLVGAATFLLFSKLMYVAQGNVLPHASDIIGLKADVIVPIPGDGQLGEVAFVAKGVRANAPARSETGYAVAPHTTVVITQSVAGVLYVKPVE